MSEEELVERYIYEVVHKLPKAQRKDLELELDSLINDMCQNGDKKVEEVLMELGSPSELAKKYRDNTNYLIGGEYYETYIWFLKIVLFSILIASAVTAVVQTLTSLDEGIFISMSNMISAIVRFFVRFLINFISCGVGGFGFVTLIFICMERWKIKLDLKENDIWTIKDIKPIPERNTVIKKGDCIVEIIFITIFAVLLIFCPQLFGVFGIENGVIIRSIPIFNLNSWNIILPIFVSILLIGLINTIVKMIIGVYSKAVMISCVITNILQLILLFIMFKGIHVFNPNFMQDLALYFTNKGVKVEEYLINYWNTGAFTNIFIIIITIITIEGVGMTIYKYFRYERDKK